MADEAQRNQTVRRRRTPPVVVGVGASAGGLEALQKLFEFMPARSGMCFVVVQHLSPDHKSMMVELLAKHTVLAVREVTDGMAIDEDTVFLLPPGKTVTISRNRLLLVDKIPSNVGGLALPIDIFLKSLADEKKRKAAAVILSGTGSDGTKGVAAIRQAGGLVVVQDPDTAKFDGMPRSVIQAGLADHVLAPEMIADVLVKGPPPPAAAPKASDVPTEVLGGVVAALKRETGVDFSDYKTGTILRRVERRMQQNQIEDMAEYVALLARSPLETGQLYKELLIGVTKFFRDADAFAVLRDQVIPQIVARAGERDTIRAWVCGCATGEEAYSIAILFAEEIAKTRKMVEVKIFATDLDRDSIEIASQGVYDDAALSEMPADLRARYFLARNGRWAVTRQIRQMIVFARHNILKDPPFTKLELVSCRNLLIYMETVLQRKVLSLFNYSLNRGGFLFLGSSESLGELASHFSVVDVKNKVFKSGSPPIGLPEPITLGAGTPMARPRRTAQQGEEDLAIDQGLALLIEGFAPPALLVNDRGELLHVFGDASRFLRLPAGQATLDVLKLLPNALATVAGSAIHKAMRDGKEVEYSSVPYNAAGGLELVTLRVRPFLQQTGRRYALLVIQPQVPASEPGAATSLDPGGAAADRIRLLEQDLKSSQESLQATVEELETSNEELQAANEELLASNEELQSTNEELQSVNEELYTLNSQYEAKIDELTRVTDDLDNLLRSTDVGTVFLDRNLVVRRFTPSATACVNLIARDIGRSIAHISTNLDYPRFLDDIQDTLRLGVPVQREVPAGGTRSILVRMQPYLQDSGSENERRTGVVVTFVDVSEVKQAEQRLQAVIDALPEQVAVLDRNGLITYANAAWHAAPNLGFATLAGLGQGGDFLKFCRAYAGDIAGRVSDGLRAVLDGRQTHYGADYACGPAEDQRLGIVNVAPIGDGGVVVSHVLVRRGGGQGGGA